MAEPKVGSKLFGMRSAERYERLKRTGGIPETKERPSVGIKKSYAIPSTLVDRLDQESALDFKRKKRPY